ARGVIARFAWRCHTITAPGEARQQVPQQGEVLSSEEPRTVGPERERPPERRGDQGRPGERRESPFEVDDRAQREKHRGGGRAGDERAERAATDETCSCAPDAHRASIHATQQCTRAEA